MKQSLFAIVLLLVVSTSLPAQSPTRDRKTGDSNPAAGAETNAKRDRVVGQRTANHADSQKSRPNSTSPTEAVPKEQRKSGSDSQWGNTAVIIRPAENSRIDPVRPEASSANKTAQTGQDQQTPRKFVQPTSLITQPPVRAASYSRPLVSTRTAAATAVYNVGIGDVLDVRLSNLTTRESTLFTVLKNGTLEYPLLNGPVSVAGMTTDEIARLLSSEIKVIDSPRMSVSVRDYASHAVMVMGQVDSPGRKVLRREAMPLYAVLAEALVRPSAITATVVRNGKNGDPLALNNEQAMATLVQPGDIIKISGNESVAKQFLYVGGQVSSPGEKVFREGMTLTQAVLSAGGASRPGKITVRVARRNANGFLTTSEYSLGAIEGGKSPDPVIQAGDRIEVTSIL